MLDSSDKSQNSWQLSVKKQEPTFEGWDAVPRDYKTRSGWKSTFRRVGKGERPQAVVLIHRTKQFQSVDAVQHFTTERGLYHITQTTPIRKTALNVARHEFYRLFAQQADRQRHIKWTQGDWVEEDGVRYFCSDIDKWGWLTCSEWLSKQKIVDHLLGNDIFGVFGAKKSYYLLIDLDLHKQPLTLFLRRFSVLLDAFHGKYRCHFQVTNADAGGIHLFLYFGKSSPLITRRKWLTREFGLLHDQFPECEFVVTKDGKPSLNIEIFPGTTPHRLPLARQRTMLLDRPLELIKQRGREVPDVVGYITWLNDSHRTYIAKKEVYRYVLERLDLSCSSSFSGTKSEAVAKPENNMICQVPTVAKETASLKGKTRGAIVGYWLRGEAQHFRHLNAAILITMQALRAEGVNKERAVAVVNDYVDSLVNKTASTRLLSDPSAVARDINRAADRVWGKPPNNKWRAVVDHWGLLGFVVSDKNTWTVGNKALEVVVDCEEIEFTEAERDLIIKKMVPLLVGKKQAAKTHKQQEVIRAVAYFLRYVRCCDREIPRNALPKILSGFNLKLANNDKQCKFLKLLVSWKWLVVAVDYYCPARHGGKARKGTARSYGIGPAMLSKFGLAPTDKGVKGEMDLYTVSHFSWDTEEGLNSTLDDEINETIEPWPTDNIDWT